MAQLDTLSQSANETVRVTDALVDSGLHATPTNVLQDHLASLEDGLTTGAEQYVLFPEALIAALKNEIRRRRMRETGATGREPLDWKAMDRDPKHPDWLIAIDDFRKLRALEAQAGDRGRGHRAKR